jgi:translin
LTDRTPPASCSGPDAIAPVTAAVQLAGARARELLAAKHTAREAGLRESRAAIQAAAACIRAVHREEWGAAEELASRSEAAVRTADAALAEHPDIRYAGFLHDAKKEYAEARLTLAFVRGDAVPLPDDLGVEVPAYLNGMAEAASELRRRLLDLLRRGEIEPCERLLATMDDVYGVLVTIDYPDAVTGGLRRTTDALRAVLERTRGDLTNALVQERVRQAVEGLLDR